MFLANKKDDKLLPVRGKECSSEQMPVINKKFPTFNSFAKAELDEILGQKIGTSVKYEVDIFSTVIFENKDGMMSIVNLPKEAQFSTVNSIIVEDIDADGIMDLIIDGNRFDVEVETTPADASPGYFIKGLGDLNFKAVSPSKSGLYIPYNVKDIELLINVRGRKVLAVGSNDDMLRFIDINTSLQVLHGFKKKLCYEKDLN